MRRWLSHVTHRLSHMLGTNGGRVVTWWSRDERLMVGFVCEGCGAVAGVSECKLPKERVL